MTADVPVVRVNATRKLKAFRRALRFALDEHVFRQNAAQRLDLSGWVIHRKRSVRSVILRKTGKTLAQGELTVHRPGVNQKFPGYPDAGRAGFEFSLTAPPTGNFELIAEFDNGKRTRLANIELVRSSQPKLLFMHIPKAGGSSVNRFLASHYARNRHAIHIESNPDWHADASEIRRLEFVSGHVPLPILARKLNLDDYFRITVLREPYSQLASHLAWVRRLADTGQEERFANHPAYAQKFAQKLKAADLSNPGALASLFAGLEEPEQRLVENCQVRYFCGPEPGRSVNKVDLDKALAACDEFDLIGIIPRLHEFLADVAMTMGWQAPGQRITENVSSTYYGLDPRNPELREAMKPLVRYDLQLYRHVESRPDRRSR